MTRIGASWEGRGVPIRGDRGQRGHITGENGSASQGSWGTWQGIGPLSLCGCCSWKRDKAHRAECRLGYLGVVSWGNIKGQLVMRQWCMEKWDIHTSCSRNT